MPVGTVADTCVLRIDTRVLKQLAYVSVLHIAYLYARIASLTPCFCECVGGASALPRPPIGWAKSNEKYVFWS